MSVALAVLAVGLGNFVLAQEPSAVAPVDGEAPPRNGASVDAKHSEVSPEEVVPNSQAAVAQEAPTDDASDGTSTDDQADGDETTSLASSNVALASEKTAFVQESQATASVQSGKTSTATPSPKEESSTVRAGMLSDIERGGLVYYGTFGYPELRVGFRQGMDGFELGAEIGLDYTLTDMWLVVSGRTKIWDGGDKSFSAGGQLGAFGSFGSHWLDDRNDPGQGIRLQADAIFTHKFSIPLLFTAKARLPLEVPVSHNGLLRFGLMVGAGIEAPLTDQFILSVDASVGPMLWHPYGGVTYGVFAYDVTVGLGFRLF